MKLRSLLSIAALAATFTANAQTWVSDSVTMGAGYSNDVFYSMKNGEQKNISNTNWHLAFQMTPQGPYGNVSIFANHAQTAVKIYPLHIAGSTGFATLSAADTIGKTSVQVYNTDTSWNYGAFNRMPSTSLLDYSWGTYDMITHNVNGDSVYLLKVGTTTPATYKVWVQQYVSYPTDSVKWKFRIAQFDGTGDTTVILQQKDYPNRLFAYYDVVNKVALDREPARSAWDILFTRYASPQTQGTITQVTNVTGVLSNFGVTVADVRNVNPDTAHYQNYAFSNQLSVIGSDWKIFNMTTFAYELDSTATFFIKTKNTNEYWQLQFTGFTSSTGKSVFRKRMIVATSVSSVSANLNSWTVAPNPAMNSANLMIDTKEADKNVQVAVMDMSGRMVQQATIALVKGVNAYTINTGTMASGTYIVRVTNGSWKLTQKLSVAH